MITLKGNEDEIYDLKEKAKAAQIILGDVMQDSFCEDELTEQGRLTLINRYESNCVYLSIVLGYICDLCKAFDESGTELESGTQSRPAKKRKSVHDPDQRTE